jgi:hypothetical protein
VKSIVKSILIFFDINRIVHKTKQAIPHTTMKFYGDCVRICKHFPQTLATKELAVASQQSILFQQGISDQTRVTVITHPPYSPDLAPM